MIRIRLQQRASQRPAAPLPSRPFVGSGTRKTVNTAARPRPYSARPRARQYLSAVKLIARRGRLVACCFSAGCKGTMRRRLDERRRSRFFCFGVATIDARSRNLCPRSQSTWIFFGLLLASLAQLAGLLRHHQHHLDDGKVRLVIHSFLTDYNSTVVTSPFDLTADRREYKAWTLSEAQFRRFPFESSSILFYGRRIAHKTIRIERSTIKLTKRLRS